MGDPFHYALRRDETKGIRLKAVRLLGDETFRNSL
jgi:hypothetical protein